MYTDGTRERAVLRGMLCTLPRRSHQCQWNHWPTPKGEWWQEGGCTRRWMVSPRIYRTSSTSSRSRQRVSRSHFIAIPIPKSFIYPPPFRLPRHQRILLAMQCGGCMYLVCADKDEWKFLYYKGQLDILCDLTPPDIYRFKNHSRPIDYLHCLLSFTGKWCDVISMVVWRRVVPIDK